MTINIESWYTEIAKKLLSLEYLIKFITTIHNESEEYFESIVKKSDFFYTSHRLAVKVIIIDFITLTNHKENFNLPHFISAFLNQYDQIDWKNKPTREKLRNYKKEFNRMINSEVYTKIKITRDKFYAHDEMEKHNFKINVAYDSIWEMVRKCQQIFNELSLHYNGSQYAFKFSQKHHEISALYRFNQIQDFVFEEFRKSHDLGRLKRVYEIAYNVTLD